MLEGLGVSRTGTFHSGTRRHLCQLLCALEQPNPFSTREVYVGAGTNRAEISVRIQN